MATRPLPSVYLIPLLSLSEIISKKKAKLSIREKKVEIDS
jgi:hypothetical protein